MPMIDTTPSVGDVIHTPSTTSMPFNASNAPMTAVEYEDVSTLPFSHHADVGPDGNNSQATPRIIAEESVDDETSGETAEIHCNGAAANDGREDHLNGHDGGAAAAEIVIQTSSSSSTKQCTVPAADQQVDVTTANQELPDTNLNAINDNIKRLDRLSSANGLGQTKAEKDAMSAPTSAAATPTNITQAEVAM